MNRKSFLQNHGICVGDIVWDNHALFPDYNEAVAQMGIPFFQALGNHDMDYRMGGDETSDVSFKQIPYIKEISCLRAAISRNRT